MKVWIAHEAGLALLGPLPPGVAVEVTPSAPHEVEFWVPPFLASPAVVGLIGTMPALRVVQLLSAGADAWAAAPDTVTLCDARGVHDSSTAEWVLAAMLSHVRQFPFFARRQSLGDWAFQQTGELAGKRILIVGAGSIGTAVAARLAPFEVTVTQVARRARPGVHSVTELPALLPHHDVVVILVPLTAATRGMVGEEFLAAMPDGALLVNAARGPVAHTAAVLAEAARGRLGFATDVTDPEPLPADHPLWTLPNVLITPHVAGSVPGLLRRAYGLVGEQLRRYAEGVPLVNVVVDGY